MSKLHDMGQMGLSDLDAYRVAHEECKRLARIPEALAETP